MPEKEKAVPIANAQPEKYPLPELMANSEALFGCKPEVIAGALHGNPKTEFTVDELKTLIDKFLKRKVVS